MPGAAIACPGCGHPAHEHGHDVGCTNGWLFAPTGHVVVKGCRCSWVHLHASPETAPLPLA